jgi:hypothetical protein
LGISLTAILTRKHGRGYFFTKKVVTPFSARYANLWLLAVMLWKYQDDLFSTHKFVRFLIHQRPNLENFSLASIKNEPDAHNFSQS